MAIKVECFHCKHTRTFSLLGCLGAVQGQDVGKRIYEVDGVLQAENNYQRDLRLSADRLLFERRDEALR